MKEVYYFAGGYTQPIQMGSGETVPGRCKGIGWYLFDQEKGDLKKLAVMPSTPNPSYIVADPRGPYLYCVNELKEYHGVHGSLVSAYEILPDTEELRLLNRQFTCGADACYLTLSPDGGYLLAANFTGGSVACFPVLADHSLGHACCVLRHHGSGTNPMRQREPHPHQIIFAPDRKHFYVPDLGLDRLMCYELDAEKGWMLPGSWTDIRGIPGQGVRHGVFNRAGDRLYVMTEMALEVNVYAYDKETGAAELLQHVPAVPADCEIPSLGAAIRLHPSEKWLYASVRGSDLLAVFTVEEDGSLTLSRTVPCGGKIPRDFVISPDGRYLLAAHQDTDSVCVFSISPADGRPEPLRMVHDVPCVTVLAPWQPCPVL